MTLKSLSFIMISALLAASSSLLGVSADFGGRKALAPTADPVALPPGFEADFVPLNTKDPKVIDLAKFAIDEYNKEKNSKLVYSAVYEAFYTKSEEGTTYTYGLVVAATDDKNELDDYDVSILVDKDAKKLIAFGKI